MARTRKNISNFIKLKSPKVVAFKGKRFVVRYKKKKRSRSHQSGKGLIRTSGLTGREGFEKFIHDELGF